MNEGPSIVDHIMAVMDAAFDPAFGEAWNRRQVSDALALSNTHALVVGKDGKLLTHGTPDEPAGFVMTRHAADEEELLLIAVAPQHRGRGLGAALLQHLIPSARSRSTARIFLEMRRGNPAIHLYRKFGFEPIGERPNYYQLADGSRVDAITFGCDLPIM